MIAATSFVQRYFTSPCHTAAAFVRSGCAMNFFGRRIAPIGNHRSNHAYLPLEKVDRALTNFRQRQPLDAHAAPSRALPPLLPTPAPLGKTTIPAILPALTPAVPPSNPLTVINQIAATDHQLNALSQNLIYFLPLYTMAYLGDIQETDLNQTLISMVKEASLTKKPIKEIFYKHYGNRFTAIQMLKIWLFKLFGSWFFFPKTITAYMEHILKEMRTRLSETRWTEKGENTERLINDLIHFLDLYKNATLNYAEAKKPIGGLNVYREEAAESMFQKSIQEISKEFSSTLIDHLSPTVQYFNGSSFPARLANFLLNKIVRVLLNRYLPTGIHSVILETNAATKPSQLPFVRALTDTATEQLQTLLENLDQGPSLPEPPPVAGTKRLKDAVENLLYVVQFSKSTTQEAILAKKRELEEKKKNPGTDAEIQQGIQDAILKGIQILLRHLAEPTNSEEMFTQFCKLANISFSSGEIVTLKDLQDSKDKLDLIARNIGKRLAKEAIEERFQVSRPEQFEKSAEEAFASHHNDAKNLAIRLALFSQSMEKHMETTHDILLDLDSVAQMIQPFSTKEQIAADLKTLQEVDRDSIVHSFVPVYAAVEKITQQILRLQELQLLYKSHEHIHALCKQLEETLTFVNPSEEGLKHFAAIENTIANIAKYLPPNAEEIQKMSQLCKQMEISYRQAYEATQKYTDILQLREQIGVLKSQPELKKTTFAKILQTLELLYPQHKMLLLPLIRNLNHLSQTDETFTAVSETLDKEVQKVLTEYTKMSTAALQNMVPLSILQTFVREKKEGYENYRLDNLRTMKEEHKTTLQQIEQLKILASQAKQETLPKVSLHHLGMLAGAVTGVSLGVLSRFYPSVSVGLGIAAYAASSQIGPVFTRGFDRYTLGKLALSTLAGIGSGLIARAGGSYLITLLPAIAKYQPSKTIVTAALSGAAAIGGREGHKIVDQAINDGQDLVFEKITEFFDIAYEFLLSGEITKPAAKILMHEVITSF